MLNLPLTLLGLALSVASYQWPSPQYDALEDFLYEGMRPDGSSMADLVRPCKLRGTTQTTVAAEWVRLVYHDTATHDVSDGSGGLDGSIFFEVDREENVGSGMTNTLSDFSTYPSKYISRSDIIAIGTVWAVATCGGPVIPLQGGRLDANIAGPFGVPNASDTLDSLKSTFSRQGYSIPEMIQLVACGHTLGGVRYPDFPSVVPSGPNPSDTVVQLFDNSQEFDHNIITQYLDGSTQDPLIVRNASMASDTLVFGSDGNVTMQSMASADSFSQTCSTIFQKMLGTVPSSVTPLLFNIDLQPIKVSNVQLTVGDSQLQFQASLRVVASTNQTAVTMFWCDRTGDAANCAGKLTRSAAPGRTSSPSSPTTTAQGITLKKFQFVVPINASQSISKFWFEVDYGNGTTTTADNGGNFYVVQQDDVLFVPDMSRGKSVLTGANDIFIAAAVKSGDAAPSRVYMDCFGRATTNYLPMNATYDLTLNSSIPAVAGYNIYTGSATADFGSTMQFDIYSVAADGTSSVDSNRESGLIGVSLPALSSVNSTTSGVGGESAAVALSPRWSMGAITLLLAVLSCL